MTNIQIPSEINDYKNAKFLLDNIQSSCRIVFEFDIIKIDYLKPFILLDYFPSVVIDKIIDGGCLTSDIEISLQARMEIISRMVGYNSKLDEFLKTNFKVDHFRRDSLSSIICSQNIKDYYVICLMFDPNFMKPLYIEKVKDLFTSVESHILEEMRTILLKVSEEITDVESRHFVDFEINVLDQKIKHKSNKMPLQGNSIRKEAQRRLSPKISSLYKRMS